MCAPSSPACMFAPTLNAPRADRLQRIHADHRHHVDRAPGAAGTHRRIDAGDRRHRPRQHHASCPVTQRTREIGVLASPGATRGAIRFPVSRRSHSHRDCGRFDQRPDRLERHGGYPDPSSHWARFFKRLFTGTGDIHLHVHTFCRGSATTTVPEAIGLFAGHLPALKANHRL